MGTKKTARDRIDAMRVGLDMKLDRCACGAFGTRRTFWLWKDETYPSAGPATNVCDECEPVRPAQMDTVKNFYEGDVQQAKTARRLNAIAWGDDDAVTKGDEVTDSPASPSPDMVVEVDGATSATREVYLPTNPSPGAIVKVHGAGSWIEMSSFEAADRERVHLRDELAKANTMLSLVTSIIHTWENPLRHALRDALDLLTNKDAFVSTEKRAERIASIQQVLLFAGSTPDDAGRSGNDAIQLTCKRCNKPFHAPWSGCPSPLLDR